MMEELTQMDYQHEHILKELILAGATMPEVAVYHARMDFPRVRKEVFRHSITWSSLCVVEREAKRIIRHGRFATL